MTMTEEREVLSVSQAERDKAHAAGNSLPDKSYPINDVAQLHAAAVLAASHHGDWKAAMALIRRRAKELGVDVTTLPGFGGDQHSAQREPGWEQRRKRWAGSLTGQRERRGMLLEVRGKPDGTGGTEYVFEGYASVFDQPFAMWDKFGDPYTEVVKPGAFSRSLARPDLDVPFLIGHDDRRLALARTRNGTMQLSQDGHGMLVRAVMDGRRSDVRDLAYAVERGDNDEMSIGFVTRSQEWSPDYETRSLLDLDIHRGDVSSVPLAAAPATAGATMVAMPGGGSWSASWQPSESRAAATHAPMTGSHSHAHAAYGSQGSDQMHEHMHTHSGDADHGHEHGRHSHDNPDAEHRDGGGYPDSNSPDYDPQVNALCVNPLCSQPGAAARCPGCGGPLYSEDGTIVLDDSGVPEELEGDAALAFASQRDQMELRLRQLRLLALTRR